MPRPDGPQFDEDALADHYDRYENDASKYFNAADVDWDN